VAAGDSHACALKADGRAFCWGSGELGALGTGKLEEALTPVAVAGDHSFKVIAADSFGTCGIDQGGALWCWGINHSGGFPFGEAGPFGKVLEPTRVQAEVSWKQVVLGGHSGCALSHEGELYCWQDRELATPRGGERDWTGRPELATSGDGLTSVCESGDHACITTDEGEVLCSGDDAEGQLGDGSSGGGGGD
jgi:alpha-tubulin suppressor-like RCC1 family protein